MTSTEKPPAIEPSSGVVVFRRGNEAVFVLDDRLTIDDGRDLVDYATTGSKDLSAYPGTESAKGHADVTVPVGYHEVDYFRKGEEPVIDYPVQVAAGGGTDVTFVDFATFELVGPDGINAYIFSGTVVNSSLLGGTVSGRTDGVLVEIFAVDAETFTRYEIDPVTYARIDSADPTPMLHYVVGADGRWPQILVPEGTYLEVVTSRDPLAPSGSVPDYHVVHDYFDTFGIYGGTDHLTMHAKASDEDLSSLPLRRQPTAGSGIIVLRKEPYPYHYDTDPDRTDRLMVGFNGTPDPDTNVIDPTTAYLPDDESNFLSIYRSGDGNNFPGHFDHLILSGIDTFSFSKGGSLDTSTRQIRAYANADLSDPTAIHISYIRVNGKFCPVPYWYSLDPRSSVPHCVYGGQAISGKIWDRLLPTMPDFDTSTGQQYFSSQIVDPDIIDRSISELPGGGYAEHGITTHRPDLSFDFHHSTSNTRFTFTVDACSGTGPTCECGQNDYPDHDLPYLAELQAGNAWYDLLAPTDMYLWFIMRKDIGEGAAPIEDPFDYMMVFRDTWGDILVFEHVRQPVVRYDGGTPLSVTLKRIDEFLDWPMPDPVANPGLLHSIEVSPSDLERICNESSDLATFECAEVRHVVYPTGPVDSPLEGTVAMYAPNDQDYFYFQAGQAIGKLRPKYFPSEGVCYVNTDFGVFTKEHRQLSVWDKFAECAQDPALCPLKDALREALRFDNDPLSTFFNLWDRTLPDDRPMATPSIDMACQYSSDPRHRQASDISSEPRFFDNNVYVATLPEYGDKITTTDVVLRIPVTLTEFNFFNCLDTRVHPDVAAMLLPPGTFGSNGFSWGATEVHRESVASPVERYVAEESGWNEANGTTCYKNYYAVLTEDWGQSWGAEPGPTGGWDHATDSCPLGNDMYPATADVCEYLWDEHFYPRHLWVRETTGPVGIQVCGADTTDEPDWDTCGALFATADSGTFQGVYNWE